MASVAGWPSNPVVAPTSLAFAPARLELTATTALDVGNLPRGNRVFTGLRSYVRHALTGLERPRSSLAALAANPMVQGLLSRCSPSGGLSYG